MAGFIEVHPRNVFQGLLLVNVNEIKYVYQLVAEGNQKLTVLCFQGGESKPIDLEESYDEVKRLIALATGENSVNSLGLRMMSAFAPLSRTAQ